MTLKSCEERWNKILQFLNDKTKQTKRVEALFKREIVIGLLYPKLDAHVSAQVNHLLKCPFNVHHDSGKLSLPIIDVEKFQVSEVPTIYDILGTEGPQILEPYIKYFENFCKNLQKVY